MTPIERAARAMAEQMVYQGYNAETKARMIENNMWSATVYARNAIEAIREPSEAMMKAFRLWDATSEPSYGSDEYAKELWRVLIDAALKEGK